MRLNNDGRRASLLLLICGILALAPRTSGQGYSQDQIKADALINLVGFMQWPQGTILPAPSPITFCLLGRSATGDELERSAQSKQFGGHKITVNRMKGPQELAGCHLVFLGASAEKLQEKLIESAKGLPIALVAEIPGFARKGGTLNLGLQNTRIIFEINTDSAEQAHLKINPRLLAVASLVRAARQ
jgi:hypothetical protein